MEAVEDRVGGNNRALALKIAAKHPGMQPYTKSRKITTALSLYICAFIHENAGNYMLARQMTDCDYSYSLNKTSVGLGRTVIENL